MVWHGMVWILIVDDTNVIEVIEQSKFTQYIFS